MTCEAYASSAESDNAIAPEFLSPKSEIGISTTAMIIAQIMDNDVIEVLINNSLISQPEGYCANLQALIYISTLNMYSLILLGVEMS